jgi:radical SAM protein with 4Fe4S-binding SPASM domain
MSQDLIAESAASPVAVAGSEPRYCAYPWQQMIVDLSGEVVPCCFWSGYGNSGQPLGNTNINTLEEIWNGAEYQALRHANAAGKLEGHPCNRCMAYTWANGSYPPFTSPISWRREAGHCFLVEIPERFWRESGAFLAESVLLEDGVPLPFPSALHDDIRREGSGRYSFWGDTLYFSTSDNSDPARNGRRYELSNARGRVTLQGLDADSPSGRNILQSHEEYKAGAELMSAKPTMISLISTADCNIDCPGCSQNLVRLVRVQHRKETVPDVLAHVPYLHQFIWHGGEPYLIKRFRQFIDDFTREDNPNLSFGFTSNGTMLTAKELEKLDKFPRINASVSVDSFNKITFEKIRAGADYDKVIENLLRALGTYETPGRIFSVGMIICKSNFLELPQNLQYAIDHDIGLNLSPVVIYPMTEQLNVFEDFHRQTRGWKEALQGARAIVAKAIEEKRPAMRRVNPTGMLQELESILQRAEATHAKSAEVKFRINDPHASLKSMQRPGIVFHHKKADTVLAYAELVSGDERGTVRLPGEYAAREIYWALVHNLADPIGQLHAQPLHRIDVSIPLTINLPAFKPIAPIKNISFSNYGETTPQGLNVRHPQDIADAHRRLDRTYTPSSNIVVNDWRTHMYLMARDVARRTRNWVLGKTASNGGNNARP